MKKYIPKYLLTVIIGAFSFLMFNPIPTIAQVGGLELSPFVGYQFGGKMRFYEGDVKIKDNMNYGVALSVPIESIVHVELSWTMMSSEAQFRPYYNINIDPRDFNVDVHYFQVGGVKELSYDEVKPYGLFSLGATWFSPEEGIADEWRFSVAFGGGAKIWVSDRVGIRLQGRLLMPLYFSGGGMYCGIGTGGSGCGLGIGSTATIVQGDFTGGLMIKLGQ